MKKFGFLFLLIVVFILPVMAFAKVQPDKEFTADPKEVKVYFFRGEGCSHCAEAEAWFKSIEKKYGDKFEVISYETWNNSDNEALMKEIGEYKEETVEGVPYILVGNNSWNGFDQSYTSHIIAEIEDLYEQDPDERYDIMDFVTGVKSKSTLAASIITVVVIVVIVAGLGTLIFFLRKKAN